jgi:hypothetical protein
MKPGTVITIKSAWNTLEGVTYYLGCTDDGLFGVGPEQFLLPNGTLGLLVEQTEKFSCLLLASGHLRWVMNMHVQQCNAI